MKTERHIIKGASLDRIEELASSIGYQTPDWVPYTVAIPGTETSNLDKVMVETLDFSGLLRECGRSDFVQDGINLVDEAGGLHSLDEILGEAAERLDQAQEEWLEHQTREPLLNPLELEDLRMVIEHYAEDDPDMHEAVDNLWLKIKGAKA